MEGVLRKQLATKGYIDRFWENLIKVGKEKLTQSYLKTRLELLEAYWHRFEDGHYHLIEHEDATIAAYLKEDVYTHTEDSYVAIKTRITALIRDDSSVARAESGGTSASFFKQIQLPKISLPSFSGDQLTWESFRDLFRSLVGEVSELAPVQKLQYLKASLSGEAAAIVANVDLTDKGYETAWAELLARYDNKRVLLATHMRTLLNSASIAKPSPGELKRLLSAACQAKRSFASLGRPVAQWDDWFVHVIVEKLDSASRLFWEASLQTSSEFPTFSQLQDFLYTRIRALEAANLKPALATPAGKTQDHKAKVSALTALTTGASKHTKRCSLCQGTHPFNYCARFKELSVSQRREHAKKQAACFNCLKTSHAVSSCPSGHRCLRCQGKHHTLLHASETAVASPSDEIEGGQVATNASTAKEYSSAATVNSNVAALTTALGSTILLSTALATCFNGKGSTLTIRALLDSGSEASFVSERVARALRLPKRRVHVPVSGIQGTASGVVTQSVSMTIGSVPNPDACLPLTSVLVLPKLTTLLPSRRILREVWPHLDGLILADPHYDQPATVDAIFGADVYSLLLRGGLRLGPPGTPTAQDTTLGWVLMGPASSAAASPHDASEIAVLPVSTDDAGLDQTLRRFWELEEMSENRILSPEDQRCESLFRTTQTRDKEGRYTVRLPRRSEPHLQLANNRAAALMLWISAERRLMRKARLREQYHTFLREFCSLGHMELVPAPEVKRDDVYYLPHHAIFKTTSPNDKIRVVFNASFRTTTGHSLNDLLLPGPKLQSELWLILSRWRLFPFAFTTDIVKMFRQIRVHEDDVDLQRILWRSDPAEEIQDFRLLTVVYGTSPAPYLAQRTLLQLADDEQCDYPLGATAIKSRSYVDDILAGGHDHEQALEIQRQLVGLLARGGFQLSKWAANVPSLCPDSQTSTKLFRDRDGVSTLGVLWDQHSDSLSLRVAPSMAVTGGTKRTVLSEVARFFDPLGWAAPVLIYGKILIQDLWTRGLSWDQPLPSDVHTAWTRFASTLPQLNSLSIPRSVNFTLDEPGTELHGFSDASSRAYAAAVYLRCSDRAGNTTVRLLVAKTKVAPVKAISIPRLELCGALLLAKLIDATAKGLNLANTPIVAWTDASVALSWIRAHPSRWKVFVANRVSEIQRLVPPQRWRYVSTKDNPADAATRGITPEELATLDLWWVGPAWLATANYPVVEDPREDTDAQNNELRPVVSHLTRPKGENPFLSRFSSLIRLLRITSFSLRFVQNARQPQNKRTGFLGWDELNAARLRWVRLAQLQDFAEEISRLDRGLPIPTRSPLLSLRPFLDEHGLLRVGGRLQNSLLSFSERHPLILGKDNHLSLLFVREAHAASLHGGPQLTRSLLLRRVWILRANTLVRSAIHACVRCARCRAATAEQQMGQLPPERTRPTRPFLVTGVDYAGPVPLRTTPGRGHKTTKSYICLFVCLSSKAVHLEVVSDLTTAAFLAAFRRFTSRRGHCQQLLSDNGTNFRGAAKELRAMFRAASSFYQECVAALANDGTTWKFIPPGAPHFGGLWEAGVKSVKYHLRRVIGEHCLTYEEMATLLTQVEACLNSRPLYALSDSPTDMAALTPGHLLIGEPLRNLPEPSRVDLDEKRLTSRWASISAMRDHFWRRWSEEYIHHLQQLRRWPKTAANLSVGDLVLIKNELQPPARWALARVDVLHPGPDGLVRVVTLKTATSVLKRPITKLCRLPVESA